MSENNQKTNQPATSQSLTPAQKSAKLFEDINTRIDELFKAGQIQVPKDYIPSNALRSAFLQMQDIKVKVRRENQEVEVPVLEFANPISVSNSLLKMVVQGMNPIKGQCYFIPYKNASGGYDINFQRSYGGNYALAKRVSKMVEIIPSAIYKSDKFSFSVDSQTGKKKILEHTQTLDSLSSEVIGAYAVIHYEDKSTQLIIKNIAQIRKAWEQGATKGSSPAHKNFTDEMAIKTIVTYACKLLIMSSMDVDIEDEESEELSAENIAKNVKEENKNKKSINIDEGFQDAHVVDSKIPPGANAVEINEEPKDDSKANSGELFGDKPSFAE